MPNGVGKPQQGHSDAVLLYLEAAAVKPAFDRVVRVELQAQYSKLSGGKVCVCVCLCSHLILHLILIAIVFSIFFSDLLIAHVNQGAGRPHMPYAETHDPRD